MAVLFRHGDPRYPFLWEAGPQPAARWHRESDGPATDLADTPDGAWAEFLRHEGIVDPDDLAGVERRLWAVEVDDSEVAGAVTPLLPAATLRGGVASYPRCQAEARRVRLGGARMLRAPSAALRPGGARGQVVAGGMAEAPPRDGEVLVLFGGSWPEVRGWAAVGAGAPAERILSLVRHL